MKYLLMLCSDLEYRNDLQDVARVGSGEWPEAVARHGRHLLSAGLRPTTDARTVRVREDEVLSAEGPFTETKDHIGGFSLIDAAGLDEAVQLAALHPWAKVGQIEVRPIWEH
ncbi:MAG: YciI family protein [Labedaea sp.]